MLLSAAGTTVQSQPIPLVLHGMELVRSDMKGLLIRFLDFGFRLAVCYGSNPVLFILKGRCSRLVIAGPINSEENRHISCYSQRVISVDVPISLVVS